MKARAGIRADKKIRQYFPGLSSRLIEEAFDEGLIRTHEGHRVAKGHRLADSAKLDLHLLQNTLSQLRGAGGTKPVVILREEADWLAVDKPPGVASHPLHLSDRFTVSQWAMASYPAIACEFPEPLPILTPHRLDGGTTGVQIIAKTRAAFDQWRQRFQEKRVSKIYLAWCWGNPDWDGKTASSRIGHDVDHEGKMVCLSATARFRGPVLDAESSVKVLKRSASRPAFLAEISCRTGVTHQVRVHLATLGFPLVGDKLYDPHFDERPAGAEFHLLRAQSLRWDDQMITANSEKFLSWESCDTVS